MSSSIVKMLFLLGSLTLSGSVLADWKSDCQSLQNAQNPCSPIEKQVDALAAYMTPAPFVSTTINQFPEGVFPKGNPWGTSSTSGSSSGGGTVLQQEQGQSSQDTGGASTYSNGGGSGGTFQ